MTRMMMVFLGAMFAISAAGAQVPTDTGSARVAPGEVLLQLSARGSVHSPADLITINIPISASGDTAIAARAADQATLDRVKHALVAKGIDPNAITLAPMNATRIGFIGNEGDYPAAASPEGPGAALNRKTAQAMLQVKLSDPARVQIVRDVLDSENQAMAGAPTFSLKDDRIAHRAAIADAIARARSDAEAYAAALGLHVVGIIRVSNQDQATQDAESYADMMRQMMGQGEGSNDVVTQARVSIDFRLAPR